MSTEIPNHLPFFRKRDQGFETEKYSEPFPYERKNPIKQIKRNKKFDFSCMIVFMLMIKIQDMQK